VRGPFWTSVLALTLCIPSLAAADDWPHPAVERLPVIARIDGMTPVVLRGAIGGRRSGQLAKVARDVVRDVQRRFVPDGGTAERELPSVNVCLFDSDDDYRVFVGEVFGDGDHSPNGFYIGGPYRIVVANVARGAGNLRHELVHPLLDDAWGDIPAWLNEGIASLYGTARRTGAGYRFLVNYRLRDLAAALAGERLPDLGELAASSRDQLYGDDAATWYALSRYLLLYLDQLGQLDTFYRSMWASDRTADMQLAILREHVELDAFVSWAKRLRR
jgi:hypothetical protein